MTLNINERISRAKIQIQKRNSFFAYLSLFLKFKEVKKGEMAQDTMGVDIKGNVGYVKEFIEKLSDEELIFVITHEIGHLVFLTELRQNNRDRIGWNCATDLAINTLLKNNGFTLIDGGIVADHNDELKIPKSKQNKEIIIKDCSKKTAEEIYDLFPKITQHNTTYYISSNGKDGKDGKGKGEALGKGFDVHIESKDKNGKEILTDKEKKEIQDDWLGKIQEAVTISKMKGDIPLGMERLVEKLHKEQIDWKSLLYNYISQQIPYNHSYSYPHKKSVACGYYLPHQLKEKIDIVIGIDVSGSVGQKELADFLSEIIGIAKAFQDRIDMRLITHEVDITNDYMIRNGNIEEIKKIKLKGGGGTSHIKPFEYVKKISGEAKCVIWLTDGYSDLNEIDFNKYPFDNLFVINKDGTDEQLKDKNCQVIKLRE